MSKLYLNGVLCNGSGRGQNEYKVEDLKRIASENGIHIPSGTKKEDICKLIIAGVESKKVSTKSVPTNKTYVSIEKLMEKLGVSNAMDLVNMTPQEFEKIISITKLHKNTVEMTNYLKGTTGSNRAKKFLLALAEKYCRCLKGVEDKSKPIPPTAICTKTVFSNKGLKGPGSAFQCSPTPLLLPPSGKRYVLEKSI